MDGSRTTSATIDLAVAEAARRGAPLSIVHVWPGRYRGVFRGRDVVPSRADGRRLLEVAARRARIAAPHVPVSRLLVAGIGRHGRFAELLYGITGAGLFGLRSANCPVALVPPGWPVLDPAPPTAR